VASQRECSWWGWFCGSMDNNWAGMGPLGSLKRSLMGLVRRGQRVSEARFRAAVGEKPVRGKRTTRRRMVAALQRRLERRAGRSRLGEEASDRPPGRVRAAGGRLCPAQAGESVRDGSAAAVGEALRHRTLDADPDPSRRFGAFGGGGPAREAAETLRTFARAAKRGRLSGRAKRGHQEVRLSPPKRPHRRFAMGIKRIANTSWSKHKPKRLVQKGEPG
jgi:hypothetical protein